MKVKTFTKDQQHGKTVKNYRVHSCGAVWTRPPYRRLLEYHIGSTYHLAKASLSRLLQQFESNVDFVILTSYNSKASVQENAKSFRDFPREYRALVGTMKIGVYELAGHWQEQGGEDAIERSWFVAKRDPILSSEDFIGAGQALASRYEQTAIIVSRQGVVTLETPAGEVWATLTNAESIENVTLKLMQASRELNEGKGPAIGYSELKRLKDEGRDSTFFFDNAPRQTKQHRREARHPASSQPFL
jgi:hypothetical protein